MIFEPCIILRPEVVNIHPTARIDSFTKIEGGQGVEIGECSHISSFCHINGGGGKVIFGAFSGCASGVRVAGGHTDFSYLYISPVSYGDLFAHVIKKTTVIGSYVVVFSNAVICPGVTIGDGAIVGAGSAVTHDIPPFEIWAGCPARFIRKRETVGR